MGGWVDGGALTRTSLGSSADFRMKMIMILMCIQAKCKAIADAFKAAHGSWSEDAIKIDVMWAGDVVKDLKYNDYECEWKLPFRAFLKLEFVRMGWLPGYPHERALKIAPSVTDLQKVAHLKCKALILRIFIV